MKILLFLLFCAVSTISIGHEYYFAFAEVAYNDVSQRFEATISVSSHDLELALNKLDDMEAPLEELLDDRLTRKMTEDYLLNHFEISSGNNIQLEMIGYEIKLDGTVNFYLESFDIVIGASIDFRFDILMDTYGQQQNKITFLHREQTHTLTFIGDKHTHTIELETIENN